MLLIQYLFANVRLHGYHLLIWILHVNSIKRSSAMQLLFCSNMQWILGIVDKNMSVKLDIPRKWIHLGVSTQSMCYKVLSQVAHGL